jgi:hypothetical protein
LIAVHRAKTAAPRTRPVSVAVSLAVRGAMRRPATPLAKEQLRGQLNLDSGLAATLTTQG